MGSPSSPKRMPNCEKTCGNVRRFRRLFQPCTGAVAKENLLVGQREKSGRPKKKMPLAVGGWRGVLREWRRLEKFVYTCAFWGGERFFRGEW